MGDSDAVNFFLPLAHGLLDVRSDDVDRSSHSSCRRDPFYNLDDSDISHILSYMSIILFLICFSKSLTEELGKYPLPADELTKEITWPIIFPWKSYRLDRRGCEQQLQATC